MQTKKTANELFLLQLFSYPQKIVNTYLIVSANFISKIFKSQVIFFVKFHNNFSNNAILKLIVIFTIRVRKNFISTNAKLTRGRPSEAQVIIAFESAYYELLGMRCYNKMRLERAFECKSDKCRNMRSSHGAAYRKCFFTR